MRQIDNLPRSTSRGIAAVSTPLTLQALDTIKTKTAAMEMQQKQREQQHDAADQTKRNDVHYLLKQLNSFSDIEEIEIVDMKQREQQQRQQQQQKQPQQQQQRQQRTTKAAAASSLELMPMSSSMLPIPGSPSTQSHKGNFMVGNGEGSDAAVARLQFDDYLFESCHYLETNYFAATYRTAMVESCSHEFRPSTTTPTSTRSDCFELHELEPPSVICKAAPPPLMASPSPPPYQAEVRMTTSGVQTELTVDSLAQLSHNGSSGSSGSGGSGSSMPRVPPFFICCYTPIDRWRARRLGAAQRAAAKHAGNPEKNGHAV
ncbi:UPF0746 protein DDB_G0281095-like [Drosophila albomicans]|uniref:UPF0746 protein DDB_G0281095-like n=1 Tax=Drosophila albomicans TaxID=7291 RepID=A0A6P8WNM0_DROAB|nr:UPF0746 protein DDB_G0281095-like [Drosophila albomicans]